MTQRRIKHRTFTRNQLMVQELLVMWLYQQVDPPAKVVPSTERPESKFARTNFQVPPTITNSTMTSQNHIRRRPTI